MTNRGSTPILGNANNVSLSKENSGFLSDVKKAITLILPYFALKKKNAKILLLSIGLYLCSITLLFSSMSNNEDAINEVAINGSDKTDNIEQTMIGNIFIFLKENVKNIFLASLLNSLGVYLVKTLKNRMRSDYANIWSIVKDKDQVSIVKINKAIELIVDGVVNLFFMLPINFILACNSLFSIYYVTSNFTFVLGVVGCMVVLNGSNALLRKKSADTLLAIRADNMKIYSELSVFDNAKSSIDVLSGNEFHLSRINQYVSSKMEKHANSIKFGLLETMLVQILSLAPTCFLDRAYTMYGITSDKIKNIILREYFLLYFSLYQCFSGISTVRVVFSGESVLQLSEWRRKNVEQYNAIMARKKTFKKVERTIRADGSFTLSNFKVYIPSVMSNLGSTPERVLVNTSDLNFKRGTICHFIGDNGLGKSTVFRAMAGCWPYAEGAAYFDARDPHDHINMVVLPNTPVIISGTLLQVMAYPREWDTFSSQEQLSLSIKVTHQMTLFSLSDLIPSLQEVAEWNSRLSSGQKQKIALLGLLFKKPNVLLLDEAFSNLDPASKDVAQQYLKTEYGQAIIISVDHVRREETGDFYNSELTFSAHADNRLRLRRLS